MRVQRRAALFLPCKPLRRFARFALVLGRARFRAAHLGFQSANFHTLSRHFQRLVPNHRLTLIPRSRPAALPRRVISSLKVVGISKGTMDLIGAFAEPKIYMRPALPAPNSRSFTRAGN